MRALALGLAVALLPSMVWADTPSTRAPSAERSIAAAPERIEEQLYMTDRPAAAGPSVREAREAELLDRMLKEREQLVIVRQREAIKLLVHFVRTEPETAAEMPDALLRLAELRWEEARTRYLSQFAAWQAVSPEHRSPDAPTPNIDLPLRIYDRILTKHPDFDRYDLVLYMKAYALIEAGRGAEALAQYRRIIDEFPTSRFVPDAHMAFAESYFSGSYDYQAALDEYEEVLKYRTSELADLALFKSAWCLWKLDRTREAATRFREVLDLSARARGMTGARRQRLSELQNEALEYLIRVFTEDERNTAADLHQFLSQIGGERYAAKMLRSLSQAFFDQARYDRAIEAYVLLLEREPMSEDAPAWQQQIALSEISVDDAPAAIAALEKLASTYRRGTPWAGQQADGEVVTAAERMAEREVRTRGLRYHEQAQREQLAPRFEQAVLLYRIHIANFPDAAASYDVHFYLGEILFHRLHRYEEAGEVYLAAARQKRAGQYTQDALYNAITSFERVREKELEGCRAPTSPRPPSPASPTPASPTSASTTTSPASTATPPAASASTAAACGETATDAKFSEAIELYVELYPSDPDVPGILFRQGRMYFERGIYDPAVRLFGQLLERYPSSDFASAAGELVLESFNRAQDYANIERWARRLKESPAFASGDAQRKLDKLILQSVFKIGEQLAGRGEHQEAAAAYLRAAEEFPRDERAPQAYYNGGLELQQAGDLSGAADAYDALIEKHPGSSEGALGAWNAAQMFESIAQFGDAARYYEAYASRFGEREKAADALYNAVVLRTTAGDHEEAVADGQQFATRFARHESVDDVQFMVGRAHESAQRWSDAADTYRLYAKQGRDPNRRVEANTRLGIVLTALNDARGAEKAFDAAVALVKKRNSGVTTGVYFAAQARYLQGDQVLTDFEAISIAGDVTGLSKRLEKKSELLRRAATVFAEVVEFRVAEWVTAALFKIGRSYELFAESLRGAPIPEGLNEEEGQAYTDQLSMFIIPIEERALEAFEGGYQKAIELSVFNSWTVQLREALTRLNDVQYPPLREAGAGIVEQRPMQQQLAYEGLRRDEPAAASAPTSETPATPATTATTANATSDSTAAPARNVRQARGARFGRRR